jgi:chromate reductase, NAD(P)H dehydrogenase (quinone)
LRQNPQGFEVITMPKPEIFVGNASAKFDAECNLSDDYSRQRLKAWLETFVEWVEKKI